ncbi:MAG: hypothetical protein ACR2OW_03145 [Methyloligellaceae bacterium]
MINQTLRRSGDYSSISAAENARYETRFYSRIKGGYYSNDPNARGISKSVRTNNPGALNFSGWQKRIKDFVGLTRADRWGNRTTIYATPESGVAAWLHLIRYRYKNGRSGALKITDLARHYAGGRKVSEKSVEKYIRGWTRWSEGNINEQSVVRLDDCHHLLRLARAVFAHEAGHISPLNDSQIFYGINNHTFLLRG